MLIPHKIRKWVRVGMLCLILAACAGDQSPYQVTVSSKVVPANGLSSVSVVVEPSSGWMFSRLWSGQSHPDVSISWQEGESLIRKGTPLFQGNRWRQDMLVGRESGKVMFTVRLNHNDTTSVSEHVLSLVPDRGDADEDGFPNALELETDEDRMAFRLWFTSVASSQAKVIDEDWHTIHQDCAGLLRFSYKEALRRHDNAWLSRRRYLTMSTARDVSRYNYPDVPLVGTSIFRTGEADEAFLPTANARTLRDHNADYIGHDLSQAQNGDLLFFEYDGERGRAVHSMILLMPQGRYLGDDRTFVVYHTGPNRAASAEPDGSGEIRNVTLADLRRHPDPLWHPTRDNRNFSGVYRWKILQ